jgi:hypothetical protein
MNRRGCIHRSDVLIIHDDVVGLLKMLRETRIAQVSHERFGLWPLGAKTAPFSVAASAATPVACMVLGACVTPQVLRMSFVL